MVVMTVVTMVGMLKVDSPLTTHHTSWTLCGGDDDNSDVGDGEGTFTSGITHHLSSPIKDIVRMIRKRMLGKESKRLV